MFKLFQTKENKYIKHLEGEVKRLTNLSETVVVHNEIAIDDSRLNMLLKSEYQRGYADAIIKTSADYESKFTDITYKYNDLFQHLIGKDNQLTDHLIYKNN